MRAQLVFESGKNGLVPVCERLDIFIAFYDGMYWRLADAPSCHSFRLHLALAPWNMKAGISRHGVLQQVASGLIQCLALIIEPVDGL